MPPYDKRPIDERFASFVAVRADGCEEWRGTTNGSGYGLFYPTHRKRMYAHRFAYELTHGPIPRGVVVCHHCDNPACVRPSHLFLGTQRENMRDMVDKGRFVGNRLGERTHCKNGHAFSDTSARRADGSRLCRQCQRDKDRRRRERLRAARAA